ncbi:methyltransferase [Roseomonas sp. HF4]|uniref:methyltransferase n=1 Tax=Roseomonas sp. HF4 TaxID=2562313 RepID=UPI00197E7E4F|nr:methyltransferase [Roseomonas sp. HF4]
MAATPSTNAGATEEMSPSAELMRLVNAYQVSQALHVAATLGVADLLVDGPRDVASLAETSGSHMPSLYRLMRALAAVGVFHEGTDRVFSLTPLGACLTGDAPGSRRNYARWIGTPGQWRSWGNLLHCIRTGESAAKFTCGVDAWTYRAQNPEERAIFDSAMTGNSRAEAEAVLAAFDFGRFGSVVDVGGGQGHLLRAILLAAPALRGVLFDQAQVVATAAPAFAADGLADRVEVVAGSFFDAVPAQRDAYVMKAILHDWDGREAIEILRTCRRAMAASATLIVIERVVGPPNEDAERKFSDLNMMVQYAALERTGPEFRDLLAQGGFALREIIPTRSPLSLVVAHPAAGA